MTSNQGVTGSTPVWGAKTLSFLSLMDKKYNTLIFDTDGTLLDSLRDILSAVNAALKQCGYEKEYSYKEGFALIGSGAHELARRALSFAKASEDEFTKFEKLFFANYAKNQGKTTEPFEGLTDLLIKFKEKGYRLFIASNKPHYLLNEIIDAKFPKDLFEDWIGQIPGNKIKPDPFILNVLIRKYNLDLKRCLYIGDSEIDVKTAINAKMDVCLVTFGYGKYTRELLAEADYVVNNIEELGTLLI